MPTKKKQSPLMFVLKALIPYSQENLMLSFRPNQFFNELERTSQYKNSTLRSAYWRAEQQGLIKKSNRLPELTSVGRQKIGPYTSNKLKGEVRLLVIFDIAEEEARSRRQLRQVLKQWHFKQVQKSVWASDRDYKELLKELVNELGLDGCVEIYEAVRQ